MALILTIAGRISSILLAKVLLRDKVVVARLGLEKRIINNKQKLTIKQFRFILIIFPPPIPII